MRNILLLLFLSLIACEEKPKNFTKVTIKGHISAPIPDRIEYTEPLNGISFFGFENAVQPDSLGNFNITLEVGKSSIVELSTHYNSYGSLIVDPGAKYFVSINTEDPDDNFTVEGPNGPGQQLYNTLKGRSMLTGHFEELAGAYRADSLPDPIINAIHQGLEQELSPFRKLLDEEKISESFFELVSTDRTYFYAGALSSVGFINRLLKERNLNNLKPEAYDHIWKEAFNWQSATATDLARSPWFFFYTQSYLRYQELMVEALPIDSLSNIRKKGLIHTHNLEIAKKYLKGNQLEYYNAAYLYFEAVNKNYEKELISLFDQFKADYPHSPYTVYVEPEIIPIIAFHQKQQDTLPENIRIMQPDINPNSLQEAVQQLGGQAVYVDVWATWCGPCKKEFQYNEALYKLLKKEGVQMLYVSIDKDARAEKWMEMLKYYDLQGHHIRANEELIADLYRIRGKDLFAIPWHILLDGQGNIREKYAGAPSNIQALEKQLQLP